MIWANTFNIQIMWAFNLFLLKIVFRNLFSNPDTSMVSTVSTQYITLDTSVVSTVTSQYITPDTAVVSDCNFIVHKRSN